MLKNNKIKKTHIVLLAIVIPLWTYIFMISVNAFTADDNTELPINNSINSSTIPTISSPAIYKSYKNLNRNPFSYEIIKRKKKPIEEKPNFTNFKFVGTIINSNSKMVILFDMDEEKNYFLREGDKHKGIKISNISKDKITIIQNSKTTINKSVM